MPKFQGPLAVIMFIAYWLVAIIQIGAFTEGIELWWGWPFWAGFLVWLGLAFLGPVGALVMVPLTFYGAHSGYGWPWYAAAALAAPTLLLLVLNLMAGSIGAFLAPRPGQGFTPPSDRPPPPL